MDLEKLTEQGTLKFYEEKFSMQNSLSFMYSDKNNTDVITNDNSIDLFLYNSSIISDFWLKIYCQLSNFNT